MASLPKTLLAMTAVAGFLLSAEPALAGESLAVTALTSGADGFDVTINNALLLRGVRLESRGGGRLELPARLERGRCVPEVALLTPSSYRRVRRSVRNAQVSGDAGAPLDFAVEGARLLFRSARRADVTVVFNGELSVVMGVVKEGTRGGYRAVFPSRKRDSGAWEDRVRLLDPVLDRRVREAVLRRFGRALSEHGDRWAAQNAAASADQKQGED